MKKIITITLLAFSTIIGFAQTPLHRTCGTMDYHNYLMQTRPNYATDYTQYNQMLDQYIQNNQASLNTAARTANITIPVVIHVLYNTAGQNISDAQATSQFAVLNNDFQRLNADKVNTPSTFTAVAGGVGITFCLAQRDPNGNATTGIIHKSTTTTSFTTDNKIKSSAQGGDDPWDVTKYINIWIGNISGGILGYGEFPTTTLSNTYGLVLNYTATGTMGTASAPYNLGRTGTHEFGHCFNLNHIWGDNGQCGNTDNCYDTPPQKGGTAAPAGCNYGAPTYPWQPNTCTRPDGIAGASMTNVNGDMFMNYMDYTDDAVMNMFSQQQCVRMLAVVSNPPYNVLASSNGCTPVTSYSLDAGITSIIKPINAVATCINSVTPSVVLTNAGSSTLTSAKVLYKMDATATQTLNWTGSLLTNANATLTLNAYTGLTSAAHTFSVWVTAPNGGVDQGSTNNSQSSTYTVTAAGTGATLPFTEGFEATTFPPTNWTLVNSNTINAANTWTRVANTTGIPVTPASTAAARMDNYTSTTDITGQVNALQSPALSFVGANSSLNVRFDLSHKQFDATTSDSLNVYISTDCGGTWVKLYGKGDKSTPSLITSVGTMTAAYTPTANAQWRRDSISLAAYVGQPSVYLKFESVSGWGNYLWLDNINVKYIPTSIPPVANFSVSSTKCVGSPITFTDLSSNSPTSWAWSFPGGTPSTSTAQNPSVAYTAAGTYTATLMSASSSGTSTAVSQTIAVIAKPVVASTSTSVCAGSSATITASGASTYVWSSGATTAALAATPTINTSYTVIGTAATGCTNSAVGTLSVTALPIVAATSTAICIGGSATLTGSGASTYSWNTGATTSTISVTPTTNTSYTVTGTATSGCKNTAVGSVNVNALPNVTVTSATICAGSTGTLMASGASTYAWNTGATGANLVASPTSNTNYTVTGTSAAGCVKSAIATIVVGSAPVITVNSSTICAGSTATLSASGVNSYTWSTGANTSAITSNPTSTTVYTVSGNLVGCSTGASQTATITVNTLPAVSLAPISQLCVNSSPVMLMGSPSNGTYTGAGVSGSMFDPSMSGSGTFNIMYYYTDANNCSNSASQPASVSLCTGLAEAFNASTISIYPNPAKDVVYVNLNTLSLDNTTIELYDAIGKLVVSQKVVDIISIIPLTDLAKGMYSIRIIADSHQVVKRIIKE
jgi:PKD repeat protein